MTENKNKYQVGLPILENTQTGKVFKKPASRTKKRANNLDGTTWTRYSISIWNDISKTKEEIDLGHPAIFPLALATRLIQCFTNKDEKVVLDPFVGIGTTAIASEGMGKIGIGFEINDEFAEKARKRTCTRNMFEGEDLGERRIYTGNAKDLFSYVEYQSIDLVITSPPYWDILLQERTADYKEIRNYGDQPEDLGKIHNYHEFLKELSSIFKLVFDALKPGKYCCVIVMDIRKKDKFYPYHQDVARFMQEIGFIFDDIIIWDRRKEYNNIRPLGYPYQFRVNKTHEYILIFQKPKAKLVR